MTVISDIEESDLIELSGLLEELSGNKTDRDKMFQAFSIMAGNNDYILLGARINDKLAGSLMGIICHDLAGDCRPFLVIENVIVAKEYRGRGIGRSLMSAIESTAKKRNCYYSMFVSGSNRTEAHLFYESIGYEKDFVKGFKKYL